MTFMYNQNEIDVKIFEGRTASLFIDGRFWSKADLKNGNCVEALGYTKPALYGLLGTSVVAVCIDNNTIKCFVNGNEISNKSISTAKTTDGKAVNRKQERKPAKDFNKGRSSSYTKVSK